MRFVDDEVQSDIKSKDCDDYEPSGNEVDKKTDSITGEPAPLLY